MFLRSKLLKAAKSIYGDIDLATLGSNWDVNSVAN